MTLPAAYVSEHVELGYATTAHRAQGRTVDTAHAYVTATTTREPLYVMATRGRESNMLYVDTAWDPDHDTAHDTSEPLDPAAVLRTVLSTSGADTSATATRAAEQAAAASPARAAAEGAAILDTRRDDRFLHILKNAGITNDAIEHAKNTDRLRPLLARMHHAERLGIRVDSLAIPWATNTVDDGSQRRDALKTYEGQLVAEMTRRTHGERPWNGPTPEADRPVDMTVGW